MKTLVFITSHFPFGKGETFIDSEFPFIKNDFDKIIIIAQDVSGERTRNIPENTKIYRYNSSTSITGFLLLPVIFILNSPKIIQMIKEEVYFRLKIDKQFAFRKFHQLVKKIFKAFQLRDFISKKLSAEHVSHNIVFYSYWLKTGAHAISLLHHRNSIKISRAHGSDIYEEKTETGYLPLLEFTSQNLDIIFFISENGRSYFTQKIKTVKPEFITSLLGIDNPYSHIPERFSSEKTTVVSCSNMIPLKRIDLLIRSLEMITHSIKRIEWLHFGDGVLRNELENLAGEKLSGADGIFFKFMGHYPNDDLLKFYRDNNIDLFINTSSTEGIPVSMMEAQSSGIPIIATDVGGVSELVTKGTGWLLPVDFHPSELAKMIEQYSKMDEEEVKQIRLNAHNNWKQNFSASSNYTGFIKSINSIFAIATSKPNVYED